ncbi:hypothetical protein EGT50_16970 [Rhodococcus xishaensis]|uniref:Uncharacterized protein n=1 Tax=Rhodococcus xishaensis TaxID=2487364 RepID=A0A3S3A214_9NOCA|nr:hypothetical protein EGT50_16970 [Rhodococcus xishaensis]
MDTVHLGSFLVSGQASMLLLRLAWTMGLGGVALTEGEDNVIWQVFWLILAVGALVMLIPVARQVFKRYDDE